MITTAHNALFHTTIAPLLPQMLLAVLSARLHLIQEIWSALRVTLTVWGFAQRLVMAGGLCATLLHDLSLLLPCLSHHPLASRNLS